MLLFRPQSGPFRPTDRKQGSAAGRLTSQFAAMVARPSTQNRAKPFAVAQSGSANTNLIDQYIFAALQANGVTPSNLTTDNEFIRRVTLDLTGRIPVPSDVTAFVSSTDPNKRAALVDKLLAKPEWVDKWTMFYGDLFKNTATTVQVTIPPKAATRFTSTSTTRSPPANLITRWRRK